MALYSYEKTSFIRSGKIGRVISIVCLFTGTAILWWAFYPIISFELFYAPKFKGLISPIPAQIIKGSFIGHIPAVLAGENIDYTKASNWFPKAFKLKAALTTSNTSSSHTYTLSIPKLGIDGARVEIGGEDLSKSLIHFTGSLPGTYGNPVIFGHSTIPWFYNPKDYKSIFTKLPDLALDDEIITTLDNVTYKFRVTSMKVVSPDDISVLEQNFDDSYITLVTCVPPGTTFARLIVRAKLTKLT